MGSKNKFDYAGRFEPEQLATYLESIAAGLRQERVRIAAGGRSIVLEPRGIVRLEIAASTDHEKGRSSVEMELSWRDAEVASTPELLINTEDEPEAAAEVEVEVEEEKHSHGQEDAALTVDHDF